MSISIGKFLQKSHILMLTMFILSSSTASHFLLSLKVSV